MTSSTTGARLVIEVDQAGIERIAARAAEIVVQSLGTATSSGANVYTVATLAAEIGCSPKVVRGAIGRGDLAAQKRGRRWLISADAVTAWATPSGSRSTPTGRPKARGRTLRDALAPEPGQG